MTVTAREKIGLKRFRKRGKVLLGNRFSLKMKGKFYRCRVSLVILHGSDTYCLRKTMRAILSRTKRAKERSMCGRKVRDKKTTEEQMNMMGLMETVGGLAIANGDKWYGHELRSKRDKKDWFRDGRCS